MSNAPPQPTIAKPSPPFFFVAGATATGKSAVAAELAAELGGAVVGCDASQLYADLPILTAQPEAAPRERAPHLLVGELAPQVEISAGWYARRVVPMLAQLWQEGKPPILCGGSGLYLRALTHGLEEVPPTPPEVRERFAALSPEAARGELLRREPAAAQWVALENPRRVQRALELLEITGRSLEELRGRGPAGVHPGIAGVILTRPRGNLHQRIAQRTHLMLEGGAVEEVAAILPAQGSWSTSFQQIIGLRSVVNLLEGRLDRAQCSEEITIATRQYAKRQETWFRKMTPPGTPTEDPAAPGGLRVCLHQAQAWRNSLPTGAA